MEKLVIIEQTCLLEEKFSKNGVQKNVHVVVKNNPFTLTLALVDKHFNFNQVSADIQLVYDCASLKEVDFVKLKPMDFKAKPSDEGDQLSIELRIKVLTSQLEDMFFRVKVTLVDPRTQKEMPQYSVLSHPIRVVSKPDQVKKKIKKRKRAPTDNLMDTLNRIEGQQKEQQRLLKRLCVNGAPFDGNHSLDGPVDSFHLAFTEFLAAFKQMSPTDENTYKMSTNQQDARTMCEILELVRAELKKSRLPERNPPHPAALPSMPSSTLSTTSASLSSPSSIPSCSCNHCPYRDTLSKRELDKVSLALFSPVPDELSLQNSAPQQCLSGSSLHDLGSNFPFNSFSDLGSIFAMQ